MQRSMWGTGHRKSGAGVIQGRQELSRPAPPRHRPVQQRRGPFAVSDERRLESPTFPYPDHQSDRMVIPTMTDHFHHSAAFDVDAHPTQFDLEAERERQTEIARIRKEILDIAREVADLRRREDDNVVRSGGPGYSNRLDRQIPREREPHKRPLQQTAVRISEQRNRSQEQSPLPNGRRHQLVERAHRNARAGSTDPVTAAAPVRERPPLTIRDEVVRFAPVKTKPFGKRIRKKRSSIAAKAALMTAVMLAGTGVITLALWGKLSWPAFGYDRSAFAETTASVPAAKAARSSQLLLASIDDHATSTHLFETPDTYGVYAVTDGHLIPLAPLPIRVPDARVAISTPISTPEPAPLPSGNLQFAVYHRELATSVPDSASVRVVAKVMRATSFADGKPKQVQVEDTWAVRGGSIELRIAPVATNREMILIRSADPAFTLSPGRYVLMFRNQAYDFSVAGTVSDTAHCLERSELQDGTVYSECHELPAAQARL